MRPLPTTLLKYLIRGTTQGVSPSAAVLGHVKLSVSISRPVSESPLVENYRTTRAYYDISFFIIKDSSRGTLLFFLLPTLQTLLPVHKIVVYNSDQRLISIRTNWTNYISIPSKD